MPTVLLSGAPRAGSDCARGRSFFAVRSGWVLWAVVVVFLCALHVVRPDGIVGRTTYLGVTVGAAVVAWIAARRTLDRRRFPWTCVALALTLSAVGDSIYYAIELLNGTPPDVSVADAAWLVSYVVLAVGLSSLLVGGYGMRRVDIDGLIDIGSFVVLAVLVVTRFGVVRGILIDGSIAIPTRVIWTAYPILDAALVGVVVQAMFSRRLRGRNGAFVGSGIALWLAADIATLLIADTTAISRWLDVAWMVGAVSLGVAAWSEHRVGSGADVGPVVTHVAGARIVITLLPLLVPGGLAIWDFAHGRGTNPVPLFAATFALVALAFARSTRLVQARNRQEAALERSTRFYSALAENSSDAVIVVDANGAILNAAPNLVAMLGRTDVSTIGMDVFDLLHPVDRQNARGVFDRWRSTTGVVDDAEVQASGADGTDRWFGVRAANLSHDPDVAGVVINLRDITDRKRAEEELSHSAFHDSLTGLANRALFHDRLDHALERTARAQSGVAVVYLDLDGFKAVNDGSGHESGDQVLREVATRLLGAVRTADTVARLGGDEFAILIEGSAHALDEAETIAQRVLQSLTAPFVFDLQQVVLSASIGIAVGDIACTASSMLRDADVAMYRAKSTGRGKWALYEPAMGTAARERLELDNDLRRALAQHQLRLVYQPIIELESDMVVGFEALLRWDHPTRGLVVPNVFIPVAEANGTIGAIGKWVLEEACRTGARWQRAYPTTPLTMAVNLSARQIATPEIVDDVANALAQSGFPPTSLILELTETTLIEDPPTAITRLRELRALDVRLAIDDFGTGYSSFSYLRQFPIDILKIDKSFTDTITDRAAVPAIVRGLLDLAKTLQMKTVAEGVEQDVQRDSLRDQSCDFGQGFLFDQPLDVEAAELLLARPRQASLAPALPR